MYVCHFHNYKIMKKLYICTIICYSGRDCFWDLLQRTCLLSYFNFMAFRLGLFKLIFSGWLKMTSSPQPSCWKNNLSYINNLMQFLNSLFKIIPSKKTAILILQILKSLVFLQQGKIKNSKKFTKIVKIYEVKIHIF